MVIATQNPTELIGTYRLPEAQLDRFLLKTSIGPPDHATSMKILRKAHVLRDTEDILPAVSGDEILALRQSLSAVFIADSILEYITRVVEATRHNDDVALGVSVRGALALMKCATVHAVAQGRGYVIPDDVITFAGAALAHRLTLTPDALFAQKRPEKVIEEILDTVVAPQNSSSLRGSS
jgi:MoxR-like ATPase